VGIASSVVAYELKLPQLAAEMEYGTVLRWLKGEGDSVTEGEPLVEVEAEKANHELEAPVSGRIESIVAQEGDEIKVGATIAIIDVDG
jgi:pyruvate/2-oxoglutarate dehydrogenase complex dihydrolipoamide acyltransferase (E2) component